MKKQHKSDSKCLFQKTGSYRARKKKKHLVCDVKANPPDKDILNENQLKLIQQRRKKEKRRGTRKET